jgi:hypothetical protein
MAIKAAGIISTSHGLRTRLRSREVLEGPGLEVDADLAAEHRGIVDIASAVGPDDVLEIRRDIEPRRQLKAMAGFDDGLGALVLQLVAEPAVVYGQRRQVVVAARQQARIDQAAGRGERDRVDLLVGRKGQRPQGVRP